MLDLLAKGRLVMAVKAKVRRRRYQRKFRLFLRMGCNVAGRAAGFEGRVYRFSGTHGFMAVQARLFFCRDKCAEQKKEGRQKEQKECFSFHSFSILSENVLQINQKFNEKYLHGELRKAATFRSECHSAPVPLKWLTF
jgi:hypothetical protein